MRLDSLMQELAIQAQQGRSNGHEQHQSSTVPSNPTAAFYEHSSAARINTEAFMTKVIRQQHPDLAVTSVHAPPSFLDFADDTGNASYTYKNSPTEHPFDVPHTIKKYIPPARRIDGPSAGRIADFISYGKFEYLYEDLKFILYIVDGRDGDSSYPAVTCQFLCHGQDAFSKASALKLIRESGKWASELHDEIWVFDQGFWQKDAHLYASMQKAQWKDVILDPKEKQAIQDDARHFFDSRDRYEKLRVPWKRGVIYHGPPGNGKTISIKALMHELYNREVPVPTLYVRSLTSYGGPERAVSTIFQKARAEAPCLLVFEDLDSLITDQVRSYFLNEVDGIATNEGVLMVGSTNHLDRLDPGISKRPSRFDRKFLFPKPTLDERTAYCEYWRGKLKDNEEIVFPQGLSREIAKITDDFSFAYLQEAFVAALLAIAFHSDADSDREKAGQCAECGTKKDKDNDKFEDLVLWRELKKAIRTLRDEI